MIYELFLEGELADIRQDLGMQLNFNIDDINKYGSRDTSFSKTIVLPGTAKNNKLLGFVGELGSFNDYAPGAANINANFNPAQTTKAELRANGLLLLKGVFRLTGIVKDRDMIEYEGNLFGELGGFIAAIGKGKLEELEFSEYNHNYTRDNIVNSWNTVNGSGYYYPLIDHGRYSTDKKNYDYRTFRPALFVKEYIDKIFAPSGYTYESSFFNSAFFKKLIIPCNLSKLTKRTSDLLDATRNTTQFLQETDAATTNTTIVSYPTIVFANAINGNGDPNFTYTSSSVVVSINFKINVRIFPYISPPSTNTRTHRLIIQLIKNNSIILFTQEYVRTHNTTFPAYNAIIDTNISTQFDTNDFFYIKLTYKAVGVYTNTETNSSYVVSSSLKITSTNPVVADIQLNDPIYLNELTPRNILQVDFFTWLVKMFNLYITEDKIKEKHLLIEPYKDYYDLTESVDWTYKVARDKPWQIKPMGMLNGRFFEYKFKTDNDYYNENFRKKFGMSYGDILYDTGFQFAKQKQTLEVGFSPSVLVQYFGTDKVVAAIYKLTKGNAVEQEEWIESNIRIMMIKKITGVNSWSIVNRGALLNQEPTAIGAALTAYGYAGHFDDPKNPTVDINFGAAAEIYFDPNVYPSANLFNEYWSGYIAEIADKDSKILTCHVYLTDLDIAQLDFSKPVFIDGVLWRINKIIDFDASSGELTKVELLKIIDTSYPCARNWTKTNYTGTTFRNGDVIPQVTDPTAWANLTTPAWCYYNNDPANEATYGKLYNWYAVNDPRGFAPDGYRVPTEDDWNNLINCLGGASVAGGKLKSITGWNSPNTGATNESGFNAVPAGYRNKNNGGQFGQINETAYWWGLTEVSASKAFHTAVKFDSANAFIDSDDKADGFSVRLIKE